MKVNLLFFAQLRESAGDEDLSVEVPEGTRVGELAEKLMNGPRFSAHRDLPLLYAVNENFVGREEILREADTLAILTPVAGGSTGCS